MSLSVFAAFYTSSSSLLLNPVPNEAPYLVEVSENTFFNPFAIKEVRFAIYGLLSRQYFCDNLTGIGTITPMFTPFEYSETYFGEGSFVNELGFSYQGNEDGALETITQALTSAASLPELAGRLVKLGDGFWYFDGEKVQIKLYTRTEEEYRQQMGDYIANQLEKTGLSVTRIAGVFGQTTPIVYYHDPALLEWSAYTEYWGSPAPYLSYEGRLRVIKQMYAPSFGNMPGKGIPGFWQYTNELIDKKVNEVENKFYFTESEMKNLYLDLVKSGITEAIRIYLFGYTR